MPKLFKNVLAGMAVGLFAGTLSFAETAALTLPRIGTDPVHFQSEGPEGRAPETVLQVYVGALEACCSGNTPVAGQYVSTGGALTFRPVFPFEPGQSYTIKTVAADHIATLTPFVIEPSTALAAAEVTAILPGGATLPENTLRFYISFAQPMRPNIAFDYIKLMDADGNIDDAAFMQFTQELWNADYTRLTLLMDPGRIKRGVSQNLTLGPALEEGQSYKIVVDAGWPTANGSTSTPRFEKSFTVSAPLRQLPDVNLWGITTPARSTRDPVSLRFDRPFDVVSLERHFRVTDTDGNLIDGDLTIDPDGTRLEFTPTKPWSVADLRLVAHSTLEDVAGNNFRDLLDHETETGIKNITFVDRLIQLDPAR